MQPLTKHREVSTEGVMESVEFGLSIADQAHIKSILRDTLYSDKILAVLREYSSNAWDAHRMAGKEDVPIEVTLPTYQDHTLTIKDYGPGLSKHDVFNVFTQYGASTKRDSDIAVGMLGIGSKSGFAYTDSFTIISRHGGVATTYVAHLDEDENDALSVLSEEPCGDDTGLTIIIATKPEDTYEFTRKARNLFQHFFPQPNINVDLPTLSARKLDSGIVNDSGSGWYAVMGCIPYRIDRDQLKDLYKGFYKTGGYLFFNIGELQISASRESLKYSDFTKEALINKFNQLLEEYTKALLEKIEECSTDWDKRGLVKQLDHLSVKEDTLTEWDGDIEFNSPTTFNIHNSSGIPLFTIPYNHNTVLVKETPLPKGTRKKYYERYSAGCRNYFVVPKVDEKTTKKFTWDEINLELEKFLDENKITGIPIIEYHELPYDPPPARPRKVTTTNKKHYASKYLLVDTVKPNSSYKPSDNWDIAEDQENKDADIYVIIDRYQAYDEFLDDVAHLTQIFEFCGKELPPIYGFKSRANKPINLKELKGTPFQEWFPKALKSLPLGLVHSLVQAHGWSEECGRHVSQVNINNFEKEVGTDNIITSFLYANQYIKQLVGLVSFPTIRFLIKHLNLNYHYTYYDSLDDSGTKTYFRFWKKIKKQYPLWTSASFEPFAYHYKNKDSWLEYIKIMDDYNMRKAQNVS